MNALCNIRNAALVLVAWAASSFAFAHEFWIETGPVDPAPGAPVLMTLRVGESFKGDLVGFAASHAASVRALSVAATDNLGGRVPASTVLPALQLSFPKPGTQVLAYESHPSQVVLPADKFHSYLRDEGLDAIIRQRESAGTADTPGRERFRRSAKSLVRVGGKADGASTRRTGQRLEIAPLDDPLAAAAGDTLRFQLRFEGRPRPGVLVKAWHKQGEQVTIVRATTDAQGAFEFVLPRAGPWLLSGVHMVPASDSSEVDWDSFWSSLTFSLAAHRPAPRRR